MSNLNIIDALIISTGVNIIFNPFIKTLIRRSLSLALTIKLPKQPSTIEVDLPDDVITIILSKLDIITLRSCTTALSLDAFLPEIVSLTTPLPESFFVPDMPSLSNDLRWFIRKLRGLKLLEVELPAFSPCEVLKDRPNLWFKWEGKIGVHGVANHFVFVFGDSVDDEIYGNERLTVQEEIRRGNRITERLSSLPSLVADLGCEGGSWKTGLTFRIKDVGGNGSFEIGPHTRFTADQPRTRIFRLASTSMFSKDSS